MIRSFVGLTLAAPILDRLDPLAFGVPGARWVERRNLHLTLVFLGEVEEGVLGEFARDLAESVAAVPAFRLGVEGLGTFGQAKPRALWAGVAADPALDHLQGKIAGLAARHGIEIDRRKFVPHITLARLTNPPSERLAAFIAGNSPFKGGEMDVGAVALFESRLGREGAEYSVLAEYGLGTSPTFP